MSWYNCAKKSKFTHFDKPFDKQIGLYEDFQKEAKINNFFIKTASLDVYIKGYTPPQRYNNISDLCEYLLSVVYKDIKSALTTEEYEYFKENSNTYDFFAPDGDDHYQKVGIINNYVKGFPPSKISWLLKTVLKTLKDINIRVDDIRHENFENSGEMRVIRYTVGLNPNANIKKDIPAEINMGSSIASAIIELLGRDPNNSYFEFDAKGIIKRANDLEDGVNLRAELTRLYGVGKFPLGSNLLESIKSRLNRIRNVAKWAVDHGYQNIYFA